MKHSKVEKPKIEQLVLPEHMSVLQKLAARSSPPAIQRRARLLLLCDSGLSATAAAGEIGLSPSRARH